MPINGYAAWAAVTFIPVYKNKKYDFFCCAYFAQAKKKMWDLYPFNILLPLPI